MEDLKELADKLHQNNQKLVLDGVFNHVGVTSDLFLEAKDPNSKKHNWFDFNDKYPEGVRLWADARSLPELNLENQEVRDYIYNDEDSVIKTYLKNGVDGWRLDVAFDIGYEFLKELADAAHGEKPSSLVIGEIWNYPEKWLKSIDALMNFTFREIILRTLKGSVKPNQANKMFEKIIQDTGVEGILKSWNVLDNHDTQRLINALPNKLDQRLAQVLQFTLPGSPNLYYGTELGMIGGDDPKNRAPMKWDLVNEENEYLIWTKKLIDLHNSERALKIGDYVPVVTENFIGFERKTDKIEEAIIVLVNPTDELVKEDVLITDSSFMNYSGFITLLGEEQPLQILAGLMHIELKPKSYIVYKPDTSVKKSYTPYKRV
jgi:glycosidase